MSIHRHVLACARRKPIDLQLIIFSSSYDDNDAAKGQAPAAPAAAPALPPQPAAPVEEAPQPEFHDQTNSTSVQPVAVAPTTNYDQDDDDDDDVDFNLGGGGAMAPQNAAPHQEDAHSPPYGTVHKASAKEDG
jgi:RNA-binding protein Musashi